MRYIIGIRAQFFALGSWIPVAVVIVGGWVLFWAAPGVVFLGGVAAGFAGYELIHYRIHFFSAGLTRLRSGCGRAIWRHHFKEPDRSSE